MTPCSAADCSRPAYRRGYCAGHYQRLLRGQTLGGKVQARETDRWRDLVEAALKLADTDSEDDGAWTISSIRLRLAAARYATPPDTTKGEP